MLILLMSFSTHHDQLGENSIEMSLPLPASFGKGRTRCHKGEIAVKVLEGAGPDVAESRLVGSREALV